MTKVEAILSIACSIFIVGIVYLIYISVKLNSERIEPNQCPTSKGEYGVTTGTSYRNGDALAIIKECGPRGDSDCSFEVNSVSEAITYCNSFAHICDAIVLSNSGKQAYIVDTKATRTTDPSFDMFEPQL